MSNNHFSQANGRAVAQVTIRNADATDAHAIRRLAELDSGRVPSEPMMVAEVGGEVRAAVAVSSGEVIADPFHPTKEVVEMIKIHTHTPSSTTSLFGRSRQRPAPSAPGIPGYPVIPAR